MIKLDKLVHCGLIIIFCGIVGYIVNALIPIESSWVFFNILGPIIIIIGLILIIIGMNFIYNRNIKIMIGAILSLLSILLGMIIPQLLSWYSIEYFESHPHTGAAIFTYGTYITGLGVLYITGASPILIGFVILELIGGILVVLGSIGCFFSNLIQSKKVGIFSGILMILGPIIFLIDLLIGMTIINDLVGFSEVDSISGTLFYGKASYYSLDSSLHYNIGLGFFICSIGGIIALISAIKLDEF